MKKIYAIVSLCIGIICMYLLYGDNSDILLGREDYIGHWESADDETVEMSINISKTGHVNYFRRDCNSETTIGSPIASFEGKNFRVGMLGITKLFKVSQKPHKKNGLWKMKVDNVDLIRE